MTQNYFTTPNEIFSLGLSPGEFTVYSFLCRCENRRTHQCWPSYSTISAATKMSVNTVRKHIRTLADKGLIRTEDTTVRTRNGIRRNGNLRYTIQPQDKAVAPPRVTPARRADREDGETATFNCSRSVFGKLAWLRFWASAPRLAPRLRKTPPLSRFRWLRNGSFETKHHQNILYGG